MAVLTHHVYGKSDVRLTRVTRLADRHELHELAVSIQLEGAFEQSYIAGDNSRIVATDTMKNTVYALAKMHPFTTSEAFAQTLGHHFLHNNAHIHGATVSIRQHIWNRINNSPIAFEGSSQEVRTALVKTAREGKTLTVHTSAGIDGLLILKTTDSAFTGFLRDAFTTLPETTDRIFATMVTATWNYEKPPADFNAAHTTTRSTMLAVFAAHPSLAVQQTLFEMGKAALAAVPEMSQITIIMPNQHRIPANLKPLGLDFDHDIFVTTDEPFGHIEATIARD
jgi:urate oxidase